MSESICHHCGAKMVEYKFTFNKGLARCLWRIAKFPDSFVEIKNLGMTTSQWTNFQKLRYWGFIEKPDNENNEGRGGIWKITRSGLDFISGKISIQKRVTTYRNKVIDFEGEHIFYGDVSDGYLYRQDYANQATSQIIG